MSSLKIKKLPSHYQQILKTLWILLISTSFTTNDIPHILVYVLVFIDLLD